MSSQLATVPNRDAAVTNATADEQRWNLMFQQAKTMAATGFYGSLKPEAALAIILTGQELGLGMMQSLRAIHVINGKPTLSADMMAGLVQAHCERHGGYLRIVENTPQRCVVEYKRGGWPDASQIAFTIEEAKQAKLVQPNGNWDKYPTDMLKARALSRACRSGWPDVCMGLYDPSEIDADPAPVTVIHGGERITERRDAPEVYEATVIEHHGDEVDVMTGEIVEASPATDTNREKANKRVHAAWSEKGKGHDDIKAAAKALWGVESTKDLNEDNLKILADWAAANDATGLAIRLEYAGAFARASDKIEFEAVVQDIKHGGIESDTPLKIAYTRAARRLGVK